MRHRGRLIRAADQCAAAEAAAPALHRAAGVDCAGVEAARRNRGEAETAGTCLRHPRYEKFTQRGGAAAADIDVDARAGVGVGAPAPRDAGEVDGAGMPRSGADGAVLDVAAGKAGIDQHRHFRNGHERFVLAQLRREVASPAPGLVELVDGAGMFAAGADGLEFLRREHAHRQVFIPAGFAIAELPQCSAPAPGSAVRLHTAACGSRHS